MSCILGHNSMLLLHVDQLDLSNLSESARIAVESIDMIYK